MIIYGKQLFLHILEKHGNKFEKIYLAKECDKRLFSKIAGLGVKIERIDPKKAQALAHGGNHQGFLAEISDFEFCDIKNIKNANFLAVLYGLSDVGNIGAIVRSAYALGAGGVILVGKSFNIEGILRASSGAALEIDIAKCENGLDLLNELKQVGFKIYATKANAKSVKDIKFNGKIALVMGSEGDGLPNKVFEKCDESISIAMKNDFDSLNVSAAFAILCDRILNG